MTSEEDSKVAARIFNALGSEVRLRILRMLMATKKPLHIRGVARNLKIDYAAVYRHVGVLKQAKLIEVYDVGRSRVLSPRQPELLTDLIRKIKDLTK